MVVSFFFVKILVASKDEAESRAGYQIDPIDLNHFFGEDGKIYGYQGLKVTILYPAFSFENLISLLAAGGDELTSLGQIREED